MSLYNYYYASLSDGDASLRIRFIYSYAPECQINIGPDTSTMPFSYLTYVIDGNAILNGKPIYAGQAFYSDSGATDQFTYSNKHTTLLGIAFDGIHHKKLISDVNIKPDEPAVPINIHNFEQLKEIHKELFDMYPANAVPDPPQLISQIAAKSYFYRALHCLENKNILLLDTSRRKLLVIAEEYMRNNFSKGITIEDTAKHLMIDRRYLYKLFKTYSGVSPKQYLNNIRISRATDLLLTSDMSITEISEMIGCKDPLQFSAFFKNQTGMSPRKYRNTSQKDE